MNGAMWFYPSWIQFGPPQFNIDYDRIVVTDEDWSIIPEFQWPFVPSEVSRIRFIGACANSQATALASNIVTIEWGFGL